MTEIRPAGREVELFNDHCFRLLRQKAQLSDGFINEGWSMASLAGGGGKGGTLMAKVGNFIVKELSAGDHKTLLQVTDSFGEHLRAGPSLLSPIFLHFRDKETKRCFFAMRNCVGKGPFQALYDLKGCADDKLLEKDGIPVTAVHKRIWNVPMWCSCTWSQDRRRYYEGKLEARQVDIPLPAEQREAFLLALRRDVSWLAGQNLMDYSLLVAIKEIKEEPSQGLPPGQPYIHETPEGPVAVYISIIDFLQKWTMGKRVARVLKVFEQNKATIPPKAYGARFAVHFTQHAAAEPKDPDSPFSPFSPDARPRHSDRAENTETAERTESQNVTDEKEVSTLPRLFDQGPAVASPLEKWDTDALPRFKLEKSEEAKFNPMPVEIGAKLRLQDPKTEFSEDQVTTEMNALEGQSPFTQRHQCCSSGWLRFCS